MGAFFKAIGVQVKENAIHLLGAPNSACCRYQQQ
jgi:hypothetical protein